MEGSGGGDLLPSLPSGPGLVLLQVLCECLGLGVTQFGAAGLLG